jgi:hypothetical protein
MGFLILLFEMIKDKKSEIILHTIVFYFILSFLDDTDKIIVFVMIVIYVLLCIKDNYFIYRFKVANKIKKR